MPDTPEEKEETTIATSVPETKKKGGLSRFLDWISKGAKKAADTGQFCGT